MCFLLIFVVLLQQGQSGGMGAIFGGGSQTAFGSQSATVLTKTTVIAATIFMLSSLTLAAISSHRTGSVMDNVAPPPPIEEKAPAPEVPAAPAQKPQESPQTTSGAEEKGPVAGVAEPQSQATGEKGAAENPSPVQAETPAAK